MELPSFLVLATPILSFMLLFTSSHLQPATSKLHNNFTDLDSLLAFKGHVTDPLGILSTNWTANTSFCDWFGVSCSQRRQRVAAIDLHNTPLEGIIAPHLANLSFLSLIQLGNCSLTGPIPDVFSRLPRLTLLVLEQNSLTGPIPPSIFNMSSIIKFFAAYNNLSGTLPSNNDSFLMLPNLQSISLSVNQLTGEIPASFGQCRDLQLLSLSFNEFSGTIPTRLGYLKELEYLYLSTNQLTGMISTSLGNLTDLIELDLSQNKLIGEIPNELGNLLNLQYINFYSNSLSGSLPISLLNASKVTDLGLSYNKLTGLIPAAIGKAMPLLTDLYAVNNQLSGGLDFIASLSNCRNLQTIAIYRNDLEGVLPNSIGNLSMNLSYFDASYNHIQGNIPAELGNLSGLLLLGLESTELTGAIPSTLARLQKLQVMYLGNNRISGPIPDELGTLTNLIELNLTRNELSGPIPSSLGKLSRLQHLLLSANRLSSSIPNSLWRIGGLIDLLLAHNILDGLLSPQMGSMSNLMHLDLSANRLSGDIPSTIGELQMLAYLDLSNNSFYSQIPQFLGNLVSIEHLNLSCNFLSGTIPKSLDDLRYLRSLDLSFNKLEGQIPGGRVFSNLTITSLKGNAALCGSPQLGFPPCSTYVTSNARKRHSLLKYILPAFACIMVLLVCLYLVGVVRRRKRAVAPPHNATSSLNNYPLISYQELVRATNNFSEPNLLGRGRFSSVFKGCLDDGLLIAVKVLNLEAEGATTSFEAECHALSMVRHRNLLKIMSTCSTSNFKALILQYMPSGSLEKWLHSDNYCLNLLQRINIMVDVSLALEHLHYFHSPVIIHCDLKPSNVLLDENMVAHVADFGIAKVMLGDSRSMTSTRTPGTIGYMAPEYGFAGKVSRKGDVYSFGILLLETFTRKRPTDTMFTGELSLRQWVSRAHPGAVMEIVDCNLLDDRIDERNSECPAAIRQCLLSIIDLGLLCSRTSPKERILMKDVVPRLQKIKRNYLSTLPSA